MTAPHKNHRCRKPRRGSERRKKSALVTSRYDETEFARLQAAACTAGLTLASYQRVQSLAGKTSTRSTARAPIDHMLLARVLGQIGKIGSNLNQIAHAAHLGYQRHTDLIATLARLRGTIPLLLHAMGRDPRPGGHPGGRP